MLRLTSKQVAELKELLHVDDLTDQRVEISGRRFFITSLFEPRNRDVEKTYYAYEEHEVPVEYRGKKHIRLSADRLKDHITSRVINDVFDKARIEERIRGVIDSISEEAWDNMVKNSDITDPDFLIEDFDEDTRAIIQAEIVERRRKIEERHPFTEKDLERAIKSVWDSPASSDYVIFSSAEGIADIDKAMRDVYSVSMDPFDPLPPSKGHASRKREKVDFPQKWYDHYIKKGVIK